jgi:hypothetical protein
MLRLSVLCLVLDPMIAATTLAPHAPFVSAGAPEPMNYSEAEAEAEGELRAILAWRAQDVPART